MFCLRLAVITSFLFGLLLSAASADDKLRYAGATTLQRYFMPEATRLFSSETGVYFHIEGGNTGPGIRALLDGKVDLAGAGRHLTDAEKALGLQEHFLGWDVLAVVVNEKNPVENLSREQLAAIFSGEITDWRDVGGTSGPIMVISFPKGAGMRAAIAKLILAGKPFSENEIISAIVAEADAQVGLFSSGITALSMSMLDAPNIKTVRVDGIEPSTETITDGTYPLAKPLALVTLGKPGEDLERFLEFATGPRGKIILDKNFVAKP